MQGHQIFSLRKVYEKHIFDFTAICGTAVVQLYFLSVRSIIYEPLQTLALKYLSQEHRKAKFHINRCPTIVVKSSMIC